MENLLVMGTNHTNNITPGKVGIGNDSPISKLDICVPYAGVDTCIKHKTCCSPIAINGGTYSAGNHYGGLIWYDSSWSSRPKAGIWAQVDNGGSCIIMGTSDSYSTGITNSALVIDSSGNVGIGTASPDDMLEVHGDSGLLFAAADNFSDVIFSANNISGLPLIEACCDNTVTLGKYNRCDFVIDGSTGNATFAEGSCVYLGSSHCISTCTTTIRLYNGTAGDNEHLNALALYGWNGSTERFGGCLFACCKDANECWFGLSEAGSFYYGYYSVRCTSDTAANSHRWRIHSSTDYMCLTRTALSVKGDIIACTSDRRLKCSVFTIQSAVEKIKKIRGVEFEWNRKYIHDCNIGFEPTEKGKTVGFIAQELEEVIPTAVREAPLEGSLSRQVSWEEKYKTIKSEKVTPLLVEAVKEQQCIIEKQQKQIDRLTCHVEMLLGKCA